MNREEREKAQERREKERNAAAKKLIDCLVKFLSKNDEAGRDLWHVLTALRGPDCDHGGGRATGGGQRGLKESTTARIRYAIGMRGGFAGGAQVSDNPIVAAPLSFDTFDVSVASYHFRNHYDSAVFALERLGYLKGEKKDVA